MHDVLLTPFLAATVCAGPAADCKREVVKGVDVILWMLASAAGFVCAWKLVIWYQFSPGDTDASMSAEITRAGRWFTFIRRVLPMFVMLLLLALILAITQDRLSAWAG